jgi:DNA repair exonuclease SbcCD ATPase subunit
MILFEKLRWKNLLSYGNAFTEINFLKSPMTLISGKNGSGKSVFLEALSFGLFGIPYRNINKPNLVNSVNNKDCLVEVEFSIGKKKYKIIRGIKPAVFEVWLDGKLIDQDSTSKDYQKFLEENILKMNYKSFTQLVVLGSTDFIPFMKLTAAERRSVIEEILDIGVFTSMNAVLKEKASQNKEEHKRIDASIKHREQMIELIEGQIKNASEYNAQEVKAYLTDVESNKQKIVELLSRNEDLENDRKTLEICMADRPGIEVEFRKFQDLRAKFDRSIASVKKDLDFYTSNNVCPVCTQNIEDTFKSKIVGEKHTKCSTYESGLATCIDKMKVLEDKLSNLRDINMKIIRLNDEISSISNQIFTLQTLNSKLLADVEKRSVQSNIVGMQDTLKEQQAFQKQLLEEKQVALENTTRLNEAGELLKDSGIKAKIIKTYLPQINRHINKVLESMDAFFNFNLDENFKETIKSRHRDAFQYESFSAGQRFRIDMALLLTWREISRKKNSTNCNILVLDEVFDGSLDVEGVQEFMKLLNVLSKKINVFAISHRADMISDRFQRHIKVENKNNFSVIKELV